MKRWYLVLLLLLPTGSVSAAEAENVRFLAALRERKLTNLELLVSRSLLEKKDLSEEDRWEMAFDAARTINSQGFEKRSQRNGA